MIKFALFIIIAAYSVLVNAHRHLGGGGGGGGGAGGGGTPSNFNFSVDKDKIEIKYGQYQNYQRWKEPSINGELNVSSWPAVTFAIKSLSGPSAANQVTLTGLITIDKYGIKIGQIKDPALITPRFNKIIFEVTVGATTEEKEL
jgi:hypothetical protein